MRWLAASTTGNSVCRRLLSNRRRPISSARHPHTRKTLRSKLRSNGLHFVYPRDLLPDAAAMTCPLCDDTGWRPVEDNSVRRVVRCDCWRDQVGHKRLAEANIPKRYQHCTLGNFTAYNESLERAVAHAKRVADAFPNVPRGLFLEGQPGVGKTHLAVAVLKQAIQTTSARGLFYDTRDLLRIIRSTYDPSTRTTELDILR